MGRRKKSDSGYGCLVLIFLSSILYLIANQMWGLLAILIVTSLILLVIVGSKSGKERQTSTRSVESVKKVTPRPPSKQMVPISWMGKGTQIKVGRYVIKDPTTYFSNQNPPRADYVITIGDREVNFEESMTEASCIYAGLPIGTPVAQPSGALGYWPRYAGMSPDQRANYLEWLVRGRTDDLHDIGYAFIYFYGLERRLLVDNQDLDFILGEVVRLLNRYTFSGSFNNYLGGFMAYAVAKTGIVKFNEQWFKYIFDGSTISDTEQGLAVGLAWFFLKGIRLPVSWALKVARNDPRAPRSVVIDRVSGEFNKLFASKYQEKFADGLTLKAYQHDREIDYHVASPSLPRYSHGRGDYNSIPPIRIPNVLGLQNQFKPLVQIWTECIQELRLFSTKVSKGISVESREAYEALPVALKKEVEHPDSQLWEKVVSENIRDDGVVLVPISKLADIQNIPDRERLTKKQSMELAETAGSIGYAIEPDSRITGRTYKREELVSIFRQEAVISRPDDPRLLAASTMLELGMCIAAGDGTIDDEEVSHISHFLENQFMLDLVDVRRIEAFKNVLIAQPPSLNGIGKRLQASLDQNQLEKVGKFMVGVAAADGVISKSEINLLKKTYKAMGVAEEKLNDLLGMIGRGLAEPVEVRKGHKTKREFEVIPTRKQLVETESLELDEGRVRAILEDTKEVSFILGQVFGHDEDTESESTGKADATERLIPNKAAPVGLDPRYHSLIEELTIKHEWDNESFEVLARKYGLMPSGAIEALNDWTDEHFGDLLIEIDEEIIINIDILEKIK